MDRMLARLFLALVALFLTAPLIVVAGISVNARKTLLFPPEGFSPAWYGEIFLDSIDIFPRYSLIGSGLIPVTDLNTDKHTDHDDHKINKHGKPVLVFYVFGDAPQKHQGVPSSIMANRS